MSRILSARKRGEGSRLRGQRIDLSEFVYKPKKYRDKAALGLNLLKIPVLAQIMEKDESLVASTKRLLEKSTADGTITNYKGTAREFKDSARSTFKAFLSSWRSQCYISS